MAGSNERKLLTIMVIVEALLVIVAIAIVLVGAPQMAFALAVMSTVGCLLGYKLSRWIK